MDITGKVAGYRGAAVRCPGCAEPMTIEAIAEAEVDVCGSCGGIWVDWFDGEVKRVAREVLHGEAARSSGPGMTSSALRNEAVATGACPRCHCQLAVERYMVQSERGAGQGGAGTPVSQPSGAELLRCEQCAGVFVPRASAGLLATLPPEEKAPPSSSSGSRALEPLPWRRFVTLLRRLAGLSE